MLIIFGIKRVRRRLATMLAVCSRCGTPAAQVIIRRSRWFSVFFIPVIPLGSSYASICTLCGSSTRLDKFQAQQVVAAAQQLSPQTPQPRAPQPDIPA
jgi:hypothetical protein